MGDFEWTYEIEAEHPQLTKENCEVGVVVRIAETSEYYTWSGRSNPSDVDGVVRSMLPPLLDGSYYIEVYWETIHETNYYSYEDLVVMTV